jgi:hypothetical protein
MATFSLELQLLQEDPQLTDDMREIIDLQVHIAHALLLRFLYER